MFDRSIDVVFTKEDLQKVAKKSNKKIPSLDCYGMVGRDMKTDWPEIIFINHSMIDDRAFHKTISCIAHEAEHATYGILNAIGEERPGEEMRAYLLGFIAGEVYRFLHLHNEGIK